MGGIPPIKYRWLGARRTAAFALVLVIAAALFGPLPAGALRSRPGYEPHAPIVVEGNRQFTQADGVIRGSGTPTDPFEIAGFNIEGSCTACTGAPDQHMMVIRNTTAYLRIHDMYLNAGDLYNECIRLENASHVRLENVRGGICGVDIYIDHSTDISITGYAVNHSNEISVGVSDSEDIRITDSTLQGISLSHSSNVRVERNNLTDGNAIALSAFNSNDFSMVGNTITNTELSTVRIEGSTAFEIIGNEFSKGGIRIEESPSYNWTHGSYELAYRNSSNFTVEGNWGGNLPLSMSAAENGTVTRNTLATTELDGCQHVLFVGNEIAGAHRGLRAEYGANVTIEFNTITASQQDGVLLVYMEDTIVRNNTIRDANLTGMGVNGGRSIRIYHNNLMNNTLQAFDELGNATWDNGYPAGGNFWSDYSGNDTCGGEAQDDCSRGDGLGDVAREIVPQTADRYPLVTRAEGAPPPPPPPPLPEPRVQDTLVASLPEVAIVLAVGAAALFVLVRRKGGEALGHEEPEKKG